MHRVSICLRLSEEFRLQISDRERRRETGNATGGVTTNAFIAPHSLMFKHPIDLFSCRRSDPQEKAQVQLISLMMVVLYQEVLARRANEPASPRPRLNQQRRILNVASFPDDLLNCKNGNTRLSVGWSVAFGQTEYLGPTPGC